MTLRHLLTLAGLSREAGRAILEEGKRRKALRDGLLKGAPDPDAPLKDAALAMIFEKPSTRTRVSFDMAMRQLGGHSMTFAAGDLQLGRGESIADTARVLSRFADVMMIRAKNHEDVEELAQNASIPVINGLTNIAHPAQVLADILTVEERLGREVAGTRWAWFGDGNNVARSIISAARLFGFELVLSGPRRLLPEKLILEDEALGGHVRIEEDPDAAASGADVILTDVWFSMGEEPSKKKLKALQPYCVTPALMARARETALFLHCLPAHRGEEVLADVIDGPKSAVWDEAENRLHVQKAILLWTLNRLA